VSDGAAADKAGDQSAAASEHLRSTAKWLATALAAIAGALLAGLQLSSLGKADKLGLAALGAGVALLATGWAIWRITRVLAPATVLLSELPDLIGEEVAGDRTLLKTQGTQLDEVITKYEAEYDANVAAWDASDADPKDETKRASAEASDARYAPLLDVIQFLRGLGLFMKVKREFDRAVTQVLIAGGIAALGIGLFAYEASHKPKPQPTHTTRPVAARPSPVRITFSNDERSLLSGEIGKRCGKLRHRPGLAIGGSPDRLDLVVLPTRRCAALRLTLTPEHGITLARKEVKVK
jgi:hypothetical protein